MSAASPRVRRLMARAADGLLDLIQGQDDGTDAVPLVLMSDECATALRVVAAELLRHSPVHESTGLRREPPEQWYAHNLVDALRAVASDPADCRDCDGIGIEVRS